METKDFTNEPLPFVPKEELCELKNMTEYICKMIAVCVCFPEKGSDRLEKVSKDGCVTKEKFDYAYSLTVVLQLIIKYFRYNSTNFQSVCFDINNNKKKQKKLILIGQKIRIWY